MNRPTDEELLEDARALVGWSGADSLYDIVSDGELDKLTVDRALDLPANLALRFEGEPAIVGAENDRGRLVAFRVTDRALEILQAANRTGLFGENEADTAERLLCRELARVSKEVL